LAAGVAAGQLHFDLKFSNCDAANFSFLIAFSSVGLDFAAPSACSKLTIDNASHQD
jgi:hypothetical protein